MTLAQPTLMVRDVRAYPLTSLPKLTLILGQDMDTALGTALVRRGTDAGFRVLVLSVARSGGDGLRVPRQWELYPGTTLREYTLTQLADWEDIAHDLPAANDPAGGRTLILMPGLRMSDAGDRLFFERLHRDLEEREDVSVVAAVTGDVSPVLPVETVGAVITRSVHGKVHRRSPIGAMLHSRGWDVSQVRRGVPVLAEHVVISAA